MAFVDLFKCGLGIPHSSFFEEVLDFYQVELVNLNPQIDLLLGCFSHLNEAWPRHRKSLDVFWPSILCRSGAGMTARRRSWGVLASVFACKKMFATFR